MIVSLLYQNQCIFSVKLEKSTILEAPVAIENFAFIIFFHVINFCYV